MARRITDAAYKVFYTAIESQASALNREHMVRTTFQCDDPEVHVTTARILTILP